MAEEFQEYEIIFQENAGREEVRELADDDDEEYDFQIRRNNKVSRIKKLKRDSNSVPVNIPDRNSWFKYVEKKSDFFDDEYRDDEEMVPPHVITGRRIAGKMTSFSVCTGYGRTLKGRDLSQVRNSILRMTGFLETLLVVSRFLLGCCDWRLCYGSDDTLFVSFEPQTKPSTNSWS